MQTTNQQPDQLTDVMPLQPAVSVVMPFETHLRTKAEVESQFQACVNMAISQIDEHYHSELGRLVISKLKKVFARLNFSSYKKSVAIFISPVFEKIIYIPFEVRPSVFVAPTFSIQQILKAKTINRSFLLVNLSRYSSNIYLGDGVSLSRVNMNMRDENGKPVSFPKEKSYTGRNELRDMILRAFLRQTDQALHLLLKAYPLPVFITGSPKVIGEFRKISSNTNRIVKFIHGHFADANEQQLKQMLQPLQKEWQEIQYKDLHQRLETAANAGHLATGIREVWKNTKARNASLLVLEENYIPTAILHPLKTETAYNNDSLANNIIDEIVEKVLEAGGDVQLVKPGTLADYEPIVLIERYSPSLRR